MQADETEVGHYRFVVIEDYERLKREAAHDS